MTDPARTTLELYRLVFPNGKFYFGISADAVKRLKDHKKAAKEGVDVPVYRAIRKYGVENVQLQILVVGPKEYIQDLEVSAIQRFRTFDADFGYNVHLGGTTGPMANVAVRAKVSSALKGRKPADHTIAASVAARIGKSHTREHRSKISAALSGVPKTPEHAASAGAAQRGSKKSSGWWSTPEGREKQRRNNHGNRSPRSLETREKIRLARARQPTTEKMLAALALGRQKRNVRTS